MPFDTIQSAQLENCSEIDQESVLWYSNLLKTFVTDTSSINILIMEPTDVLFYLYGIGQ